MTTNEWEEMVVILKDNPKQVRFIFLNSFNIWNAHEELDISSSSEIIIIAYIHYIMFWFVQLKLT